jgi:hypothetical protein
LPGLSRLANGLFGKSGALVIFFGLGGWKGLRTFAIAGVAKKNITKNKARTLRIDVSFQESV